MAAGNKTETPFYRAMTLMVRVLGKFQNSLMQVICNKALIACEFAMMDSDIVAADAEVDGECNCFGSHWLVSIP